MNKGVLRLAVVIILLTAIAGAPVFRDRLDLALVDTWTEAA